jgi:cell division protein FtsA
MTTQDFNGVIELGNTNLRCIIGSVDEDSKLKIIGYSKIKSQGIHNGTIINLKEAADAIRSCLSLAEKKADEELKKVTIVLEQPEFLCTKLSKHRKINGSKIHKDDIAFLLKEAKKQVTANDPRQSIIHIFNHNYIVDGKKFNKEPINVYADHLSHEMNFITMSKNIIKNINQSFVDCDIEIERFISSTFALAVNYFTDVEFRFGSILIDIGYEKTSLGIFKNFTLVHSITFPIGINHVTKDISRGCSLSLEESENIKNKIGLSFAKEESLPKNFFQTSKFRKISRTLLLHIMKARIEEIFEIIKKEINSTEMQTISGKNIFITGGGANLPLIEQFSQNFFGTDVKILGVKNNNEITEDSSFASCLGALKIINLGWETEAIPEIVNKVHKSNGFFAKIFGISE